MTHGFQTPVRSGLICLRAIILDLDGVVAETEDLHRQAYNLTFEEAGIPLRWSYQDYRDRLVLSAGSKLKEIPVPDGQVDASRFHSELYSRKRSSYIDLLNEVRLPPRPGVLRLIDEAFEAGVRVAIASTCDKEGALVILKGCLGTGRISKLSSIRAGNDALRRKPAPDIYLLALGDLGLPAPSCVAIEDTRHGLESAHGAGLWTLVTPSQYTVGDDFNQANLVVEDLDTGGISLERLDNELRKAAEEKMPQPAK
jgi:beta-phosphoglucomutase-like phosphatase (HAD superfamily)